MKCFCKNNERQDNCYIGFNKPAFSYDEKQVKRDLTKWVLPD